MTIRPFATVLLVFLLLLRGWPVASAAPAPPTVPPRTEEPASGSKKAPRDLAKGERAKALYDFNAENADELSLTAGSIITVTDKSLGEWWSGTLAGKSGIFPANYVELLPR